MVKLVAKYLERFKYYPPYVGQKVIIKSIYQPPYIETEMYGDYEYNIPGVVTRIWLNGSKSGDKAEIKYVQLSHVDGAGENQYKEMYTIFNMKDLIYTSNKTTQILYSSKANNR